MKTLVSQIVVALVLLAAAFACWTAGQLQQSVADAHERMALLQYDALDGAYDAVETSMGSARRVPWLAGQLLSIAKMDEQRAGADYWRGRYVALTAQQSAAGAVPEKAPEVMALAADAAYRTDQREAADRQDLVRRLDGAVKNYAEVLKKNPGDTDAAYNYEYIVRLRDTVAKGKALTLKKAPGLVMAGDLPAGRTIHGDPGAPPADADLGKFKMIVPKREDERGPGDKAGDGKLKERKG